MTSITPNSYGQQNQTCTSFTNRLGIFYLSHLCRRSYISLGNIDYRITVKYPMTWFLPLKLSYTVRANLCSHLIPVTLIATWIPIAWQSNDLIYPENHSACFLSIFTNTPHSLRKAWIVKLYLFWQHVHLLLWWHVSLLCPVYQLVPFLLIASWCSLCPDTLCMPL